MQEKKDLHAKLALCYELYWAKNKVQIVAE